MEYLPKNLSVFLNDTKVIKARIFGKKDSSGKVELLVNRHIIGNKYYVYIKGKVNIDTTIYFDKNLKAKVVEIKKDGMRIVEFFLNNKFIGFKEFIELLELIGHIPLPVYINRKDDKDDENDYQTLFAKNYGSVASPTASLHFTNSLLNEFNKNFDMNYITLHIGSGTFKPVECSNIFEHEMHSEYYNIPYKTLDALASTNQKLAIGTTSARTIEYYARTKKIHGECDLFLNPHNKPMITNMLLTNFHLPRSTLIMLVASFVGLEKTLELYDIAIKQKYRFYSYGDAMLIL